MDSGRRERDAALAELRRRLDDGLALAGLTKTQLAARAELGRTTVQEAFNHRAPVPTAGTVAALADALGLPVAELLGLRRSATAAPEGPAEAGPLGKPIGDWDPHHLEVHPAGPGVGPTPVPLLSGYVSREHDRVLADAVAAAGAGHRQMVVLVGSSSTGKTRACWEAVQPLAAQGWRLWHPFDPSRVEAALEDLARVGPRTVVWLNEAQHYLGDARRGERVAAALRALLTAPDRGPVLVLGTLWPEYARRYTAPHTPGAPDPHSHVRELLAGRIVPVAEVFDAKALREATVRAKAGDRLLADALGRAGTSGRVAQDLAGAPLLQHRYLTASPGARALLEAAMDARRLGVGLHLPEDFLTAAAVDYIGEEDYDGLQHTADWERAALNELAQPVHGKQAPLRATGTRPARRPPDGASGTAPGEVPGAGRMLRLADYLEQYGRGARRRDCPPESFWSAAHAHLTHADDLRSLAAQATARHRLRWAHHLSRRADSVERGGTPAPPAQGVTAEDRLHDLMDLVWESRDPRDPEVVAAFARDAAAWGPVTLHTRGIWRVEEGELAEAAELFRQAAESGHPEALGDLAMLREGAGDPDGAEDLARAAARAGHTAALQHLAELREQNGDRPKALASARALADAGSPGLLCDLASRSREEGDAAAAEELYRHAADAGSVRALHLLSLLREEAGDRTEAEALARRAADGGRVQALFDLAVRRAATGDVAATDSLFRQAEAAGHPGATRALVVLRERAGRPEDAEALARRAAGDGRPAALRDLAVLRAKTGDGAGAERLFQEAADAGHPYAMLELIRWRDESGDRPGAEALARRAVHTDVHRRHHPLHELARWRDRDGVSGDTEPLYREAAALGDDDALMGLAVSRDRDGCHGDVEGLYREAADAGSVDALRVLGRRYEERGDERSAAALFREAADAGQGLHFRLGSRWPAGLDADGEPTPPWGDEG
ncbi:helix-turn-helix domain-containing protein [Streptomyces sp. NRRL S-87]|uniref:helix-turn-helix domain-containing protein n=1 Tax=Streptomyces sp. NRRL S-87 TaxID=1463920 RepID=UPI0007C5A1A9|nr:helix-turn-helix domain-containing protein [Streptomyces sp. NRRL S-87]